MAKTIPVLSISLAAIATVVLLGVGGLGDGPAPPAVVQDAVTGGSADSATYTITPQRLKASQHTSAVGSQDYEAAHSDTESEWDAPDLLPDAEATHDPVEMRLERWNPDLNNVVSAAFDSEGNLFSASNYQVSRIDASSQEETVWTMPDGWKVYNSGSTVDDSGYYYFKSLGSPAKLDHTSGVFTLWNVTYTRGMHSVGNEVYFTPYVFYTAKDPDLKVTGMSVYSDISDGHNRIEVYGDGASHPIWVELTLPSGEVVTERPGVGDDATFFWDHDRYLERADISKDLHLGTYSIRVQDSISAHEAQFEVDSFGDYGSYPTPQEANAAILQKLDPNTNKLTTFFMDASPHMANSTLLPITRSGGEFYYDIRNHDHHSSSIMKFVPATGDITYWPNVSSGIGAAAISGDTVYWSENAGRKTIRIVGLDTDDNTVTRVTSPYQHSRDFHGAVADSLGNVFFTDSLAFYRFTPSSDTFTKFNTSVPRIMGIGPDDTIYAANYYSLFAIDTINDVTGPDAVLGSDAFGNNTSVYGSAVTFYAYFDERVSGFEASDIDLGGGSGSIQFDSAFPRNYLFHVHAPDGASLAVSIPAGAVTDHSGNPNTASDTHNVILNPLSSVPEEAKAQWHAENATIRIAYHEQWGPFEFEDSTGNLGGITARYVELLGGILSAKIVAEGYESWRELYDAIDDGDADVALMGVLYHDPVEHEDIQFTDSHMSVPLSLVTVGDQGFAPEDLGSSSGVVVISDSPVNEWTDRDGVDHVNPPAGYGSALRFLADGGYPVFLTPWPVAQYHALQDGTADIHNAGDSGYVYDLRVGYNRYEHGLGAVMQEAMASMPEGIGGQMLADANAPGNGDPVPVLSSGAGNGTILEVARVEFAVDFGETVTGFDVSDIVLNNTEMFSIEGLDVAEHTFEVVASGHAPVSVGIRAGAVADLYGNASPASDEYVVRFGVPDES